MQRDMDLVRDILLALENHEHGFAPQKLNLEGYSEEQIGYHALLMDEAGLSKAVPLTALNDKSPRAMPRYITWQGYEFLTATKKPSVWNQAKSTVLDKTGAISFELVKMAAIQIAKQHLGLG